MIAGRHGGGAGNRGAALARASRDCRAGRGSARARRVGAPTVLVDTRSGHYVLLVIDCLQHYEWG
jgi:hypothetical protein